MSWLVTVAVLGFDLERGRRLAHDHPPPPITPPSPPAPPSPPPDSPPYAGCDYNAGGRSCDDDLRSSCDEQSEDGSWDRSCDMNPTAGCDDWSGCTSSPPPPLAPAPPGGYAPPPGPPPKEPVVEMVVAWSVIGLVLLLLCICCCIMRRYSSAKRGSAERGRIHYWCCCCVEFCRYSNWNQGEHNGNGVPVGEKDPQLLTENELRQRNDRLTDTMKRDLAVAAAIMPPLHLAPHRV